MADGFDLAELDNIPAISEVFDYAGMRYSKLEGQVRYVVPLSQISPNFINALLAREDSRFYKHRGVDLTGIARAAMRNMNAGNVKEGASTITQQLARNTFDLGDDRWQEVCRGLARSRIEKNLSKEKSWKPTQTGSTTYSGSTESKRPRAHALASRTAAHPL